MKTSYLFKIALLAMIAVFTLTQAGAQQPPNMKMTTEIPEGIATDWERSSCETVFQTSSLLRKYMTTWIYIMESRRI
jgi:hypothetical protein